MKNVFVTARQFAKFARRHWKFIIGVCTSCTGMYLMSKGEYDTGMKDACEVYDATARAWAENDFIPDDEVLKKAGDDKWKELYG